MKAEKEEKKKLADKKMSFGKVKNKVFSNEGCEKRKIVGSDGVGENATFYVGYNDSVEPIERN